MNDDNRCEALFLVGERARLEPAVEGVGKRSFADQPATTSRYPASYASRVSNSA
jgi:hypothetical protein